MSCTALYKAEYEAHLHPFKLIILDAIKYILQPNCKKYPYVYFSPIRSHDRL